MRAALQIISTSKQPHCSRTKPRLFSVTFLPPNELAFTTCNCDHTHLFEFAPAYGCYNMMVATISLHELQVPLLFKGDYTTWGAASIRINISVYQSYICIVCISFILHMNLDLGHKRKINSLTHQGSLSSF